MKRPLLGLLAALVACAACVVSAPTDAAFGVTFRAYTPATGATSGSTFFGANLPTLPQLTVDTSLSLPGSCTYSPANTAALTTAFANANAGDKICLDHTVTYAGPFTLRNITGNGWVYVVSDALASLPAAGTRATASDAGNMPKIEIVATSGAAIVTATQAHHYRFIGVEIRPTTGNFVYALVELGLGETSTGNLPHHFIFDRCYIHGYVGQNGPRRGIAANGNYVAVIDSTLNEIKEVGADTQTINAYNAQGPILIRNNDLEAAGEIVMIGGAYPPSLDAAFIPSDITIQDNYFYKTTALDTGGGYSSKNLLELKLGKRVLIQHNHFENQQGLGQKAFCILVTPRDEHSSGPPWFPDAEVSDVTLLYNRCLNVGQGIDFAGSDDGDGVSGRTSKQLQRVLLRHSIFALNPASDGREVQITGGGNSNLAALDLIIDHVTFLNQNGAASPNSSFFCEVGATIKTKRFVYVNSITRNGGNGFNGTSTPTPSATLAAYFESDYVFTNNAHIDISQSGQSSGQFPAGNYFPAAISNVGFTNYATGDYSLTGASTYHGLGLSAPSTSDGSDLGANTSLVAP